MKARAGSRSSTAGRLVGICRVVSASLAVLALALGPAAATHASRAQLEPGERTGITGDDSGTGGLAIRTVDPAGTALTDYCYGLFSDGGGGVRNKVVAASRCDGRPNPDGSANGESDGLADGSLGFSGVPAGRYVLGLTRAPVLTRPPAYEPIADQVVSVTTGQVSQLTITQYRAGTIVIRKVDPAGAPLAGACFSLTGGSSDAKAFGCDGPGVGTAGPGDGLPDGILVLTPVNTDGTGVSPGSYTLAETRPPDGYAAAPDQTVTTEADRATRLTVTNRPGPAGTGGLAIRTVDPAGIALTDYCYGLFSDGGGGVRSKVVAASRCDGRPNPDGSANGESDGLADGSLGFSGVPAGRYVLGLTRAPVLTRPPAYEPIADQVVSVTTGQVSQLTITQYRAGTIVIRKVDPAGAPLAGACFSLTGGSSDAKAFGCDGPGVGTAGPGDGLPDGILVLTPVNTDGTGVSPGSYTLAETRPPDGYAAAPDQTVTTEADRATRLTVTNRPGPAGTGGLAIRTVDPAGIALTDYCYGLFSDGGGGIRDKVVAASRCDGRPNPDGSANGESDGLADGSLGFSGVPAGRYVLGLTRAPVLTRPPAYEPIADQVVSVTTGQVSQLTITQYRAGTIVIRKVDPAGAPLAGACFSLTGGSSDAKAFGCDGPGVGTAGPGDGLPDGILVLTPVNTDGTGVSPGSYTLAETRPPDGYAAAPDQTVTTEADRATRLKVTNRPGPAGTGGVAIIGLVLEIDSRITIDKLTGMPVSNGVTMATGRISLEGDVGSGSWHGSGKLTSATNVPGGETCGSLGVTGSGTYDWVIRSATASPELTASNLVVHMDSGPIVEAPDTFTMGGCPEPLTGTLNTWENLFFDTYRGRYAAMGFRVDGWTLIDGVDAWTTGGVIAEAQWAGACGTTIVLGCTDATTFRLVAVVLGFGPAGSGEPTPGGGGATADPSAGSGTSPGSGTPSASPGAVDCGDLARCLTSSPALLVIGALLAVTLVGGGTVFRMRAAQKNREVLPLKVTPPSLGAAATDTPMDTISVNEEGLEFDKLPADGDRVPADFDKLPPDFDKLPPDLP